jgi:hypothetical protein
MEHDQLVFEKGLIDFGEQRGRHGLLERDAGDLAAEHRMQRQYRERPVPGRVGFRYRLGLRHDDPPGGPARLWQRRDGVPRHSRGFRGQNGLFARVQGRQMPDLRLILGR